MPLQIDDIVRALENPVAPVLGIDQKDWPLPADPVQAAVLVPIICAREPRLLLTTRTSHLRSHAGQVAFPGGRVDPEDATPTAAALREAWEEVGLVPEAVRVLGVSDVYRTGSGYDISPVVGVLPDGLHYRPNPSEVADIFEVPLDFVMDRKNHVMRETLWQGHIRRYYVIEWQDRTIWGATAGMLVNLAARLT